MTNFRNHLINKNSSIKNVLDLFNKLGKDAIVFVVDENERLLGSLTDGDIRRGLLKGLTMNDPILNFTQGKPRYISKSRYSIEDIISLRNDNFRILPILDSKGRVIKVINFRFLRSYLPLDTVIMAGGRGQRLRPLTDTNPKPLLKVGEKPIIDHNLDRLIKFGIDDFWISLGYLGEKIKNHLGNGETRNINLNYVWEKEPLGTIGAVSMIKDFTHDHVLVTNSDLLTTLNYEDFFLDHLKSNADMTVATIPYSVNIPYGVLETIDGNITSFKEKPTYTYYSNAGIYIIKKEILKGIPKNSFFNSTDLMQDIIDRRGRLNSYPIRQYWLDVGKMEDFEKAQNDIKHLEL